MSHRIVVLGAGYAGLSAAKRLSALTDAQIVLVNQREEFVHRVRLHQIATGQRLPSPPLRQLLRGTRVQLKIGLVTGIDPENQLVHLGEAAPLHYDTLLYALGSRTGATAVGAIRPMTSAAPLSVVKPTPSTTFCNGASRTCAITGTACGSVLSVSSVRNTES